MALPMIHDFMRNAEKIVVDIYPYLSYDYPYEDNA